MKIPLQKKHEAEENYMIQFKTKIHLVKTMIFPVVMYGCESWTIKKAECRRNGVFGTVVLEKTLESPLDCKEIQPVHPKGNQSWIFIGRTDVEAETPTLWPPDATNWLIWKDPDAGKDWKQKEKGMTEDEMVEWHQQLNGHDHGVRKSRTRLSDWTELKYTQRSTWKKSILNWKFKS